MLNKILIICPSRNRPQNMVEVVNSWIDVSHPTNSQLCFALDDDNENQYPRIYGVKYEINPRIRMCPTLNKVANDYSNEYKYIGFIGDDHRFRTPNWDSTVVRHLDELGPNGIVYGNDLLQGELLPTAVFLNSNIVRRLGYMVPPTLVHMYADNFWRDLGNELGTITYLPDVVVEHCHWANGKAEHDIHYDEVDEFTQPDQVNYTFYKATKFQEDVRKLRG